MRAWAARSWLLSACAVESFYLRSGNRHASVMSLFLSDYPEPRSPLQSRVAHRAVRVQVLFWDRRSGKLPVSCVAARHASGQLMSLQAVPDGRVVYAGTQAGEVRVVHSLAARIDTLKHEICC